MSVASRPAFTMPEFLALPDHGLYELVDGELREINVSNLSALKESDMLDGERVVPGFSCRVGELIPTSPA